VCAEERVLQARGAGRGARGAAVQWAAQRSEGREQSPRPAERGAHNKDVVSCLIRDRDRESDVYA